jgi:two-component system, cell cycle sensor histidine kinase and response regulator CckA
MKSNPWPLSAYERASRACGLLVVIISGAALTGWFTGSVTLKGIRAGYIPMAPNTALMFVLLGASLATFRSKSRKFLFAVRTTAVVAAGLALIRLSEYLTGVDRTVDHWFFRFPAERLGLAPVGKMAFFTAMTFFVLGLALFLVSWSRPRWPNDAARVLSVVVAFMGLAFLLGYLYGAPLLYGGRSIPMALNTAICFFIFGAGLLVRVSIRDTTERRSAHEALQQARDELEARVKERTRELRTQQEFLRAVVDTSPNAIFVKDSQGRFTLVNKAVEDAYGRSAEEIIGRTEADFNGYHEEIQTFVQDDTEVLQTLSPKFIPEEQLTNPKTGETRSFQTIKVPLKLPGTEAVHILGVATDITDRNRAEQALRESEERYRLLFESNPQAMWVYDRETFAFLAINEAAVFHYGYSREEFLSMTIKDIRDLEDVPALLDNLSEVNSGVKVAGTWKHRKKDGSTIDVEIISHPLVFAGRNAKLVLANDITERKQAEQALRKTEEQLRQSQKLESVGQLAGGIAHDFNNLLTVIGGYSDLILQDAQVDARAREKLEEVKKAAQRAASLTRQLLAFSRKQVLKPEVLDLNSLVDGLGKMLRRLIGEDVEIITSLKPDVGKINADPGQIEQVLINLVVNARDAMPTGGKITIETANVELDSAYSDMHIAAKPGSYVMLAVSDTGTGMDAATRKHIFEPFFTTKEVGRGTGLGLSMIYGIVKQSAGNIWVYSEPGQGTTFKVYLPQVKAEQREKASEQPQQSVVAASETILLVEDEEMVRKLACDILQTTGYQVLVARHGDEAIGICEAYAGTIDLMLTDVVMPRMNGRKVAESVRQFRPKMKVLYMSGYTDDAIVHHGALEAGTNFIEKPFTAESLTSKVRETLSKAREKNEEPVPLVFQNTGSSLRAE